MNRRLVLACLAAGTAAVTVVASSPVAQAVPDTTALPGYVVPAGVVRLEATAPPAGSTVRGARVALYSDTAATQLVRAIPLTIDSTCRVTNLATVAQLLDISVVGARSTGVYLEDNGLGNYTKGNGGCNNNAGRITAGGAIIVKPGSALHQDFLSAKVNIESKYGATLAWTATGAGTTVPGGSGTAPLNTSSDSGPDAGYRDNNLITIDPTTPATATTPAAPHPFDALRLAEAGTTNGTIALDDGGDAGDALTDPTGHGPSVFYLGQADDFQVDCDRHNTVSTTNSDTTAPIASASFARQPNGFNPAKDPTCKLIGVTLQIQSGQALIGGSLRDVVSLDNTVTAADGSPQQVRAYLTIVWRIPRYDSSGALRPPADIAAQMQRQIDYTADDSQWQPVQWCGHLVDPSNGAYDPATADHLYPQEPQHPAGQAWCLTSDESHLEGDVIVQTQVYHGAGDPRFGPG